MNEREQILRFAAHLPRAPGTAGEPFDCDAELVRIGGEPWAVTVDEFTPEEDGFTSENPERLGRNLGAATVSDLLAAGAVPRFFLSSLALPRALDACWLDGLSRGLGSALAELGCGHCGGDLGTAAAWRFNGIALGPVVAPAALTHRIPEGPQALCVTGALGDLNLAALLGAPTPAIEIRGREAEFIRRAGTACIDTSGGFFDALWLLHERNPGRRIVVDRGAVPLAAGVAAAARSGGWPPEAALLGGAGEYELLFAMPRDRLPSARAELAALGISVVGEVDGGPGGLVVRWGGIERPFPGPPPDPRAADSPAGHAQAVLRAAVEFFA